MSEDRCIMCGDIIPEGRMVCLNCDGVEPSFNTIKTTIVLDKITDIKDFVNLISKCHCDVTVGHGRFAVDAKSIMGLFSLDLSKPLKVEFYGSVPCEVREGMRKFIVE